MFHRRVGSRSAPQSAVFAIQAAYGSGPSRDIETVGVGDLHVAGHVKAALPPSWES